ncbi:hypothetical protein [Brevundimonas sp. UBA2416]|uniref:hypothetical protein n=1 Tax=Brevundimonas sp. UBA2416 TaxID=1946124 RepID=UPI0025BDD254|nr:hypothetical protein [Brevundimonas sp. UBA2416]
MSLRTALAAAAVLALATPVFGQEAPAADPAAAAAAQAEAAFEAKALAFQQALDTMRGEMQAALTAAGSDQVKANADMDAIAARYQPQADGFAAELDAFITSQLPVMPPQEQAQMAQMGPMIRSQIVGAPATIKAGLLQAAAAAAAPAAPR